LGLGDAVAQLMFLQGVSISCRAFSDSIAHRGGKARQFPLP
jgi:hypothetical protein